LCAIADGVNKQEYHEPELGAEYYEQVPEVLNCDVTPGPIWMAHEWPMSAGARV
jgi:hypothetical protein